MCRGVINIRPEDVSAILDKGEKRGRGLEFQREVRQFADR